MSKVLDQIWPGAMADYEELLNNLDNNTFGPNDTTIDFRQIVRYIDKYSPNDNKIPMSFFTLMAIFGNMGNDAGRNAIWVDYNYDPDDSAESDMFGDGEPDGSLSTPYTNIQDASNDSNVGDTIIVLPARDTTAYGSVNGSISDDDVDCEFKMGVNYIIYPGLSIVGPVRMYYDGPGGGDPLNSDFTFMGNSFTADGATAETAFFTATDGNIITMNIKDSSMNIAVDSLSMFAVAAAHTSLCTLSFRNSTAVITSASRLVLSGTGANFVCAVFGGCNLVGTTVPVFESTGGGYSFSSESIIANASNALPTLRFTNTTFVNASQIRNTGTAVALSATAGSVTMYAGSWFLSGGASSILLNGAVIAAVLPCSQQTITYAGAYAGTITAGLGANTGYVSGDPGGLGLSGLAGQIVYDTTAGPPATLHMLSAPGVPTWDAI